MGLCDIEYPPETYLKIKHREIPLPHIISCIRPIGSKFINLKTIGQLLNKLQANDTLSLNSISDRYPMLRRIPVFLQL